jgi:hypothetical protein
MKKDKNIDQFIRKNLNVEKTPLNFSNKIMHQIYASEKVEEKALTSLLQKHTLKNPSVNFTSKVLLQIQAESKSVIYQPVISKKAWYLILSIFMFFIFYVFFYMDNTSTEPNVADTYLLKIESLFSFNFMGLISSPIFALSIFALSTLLFLDNMFRDRSFSS